MTMNLPSISNLFSSLKEIVQRFPFVVLNAIVLAITSMLFVHNEAFTNKNVDSHDFFLKISFVVSLGLALQFAISTFCERKQLPPLTKILFSLGGIGLLTLFYFVSGKMNTEFGIRLICYSISVHMIASVFAFWNDKDPLQFWKFNKDLFLRFLLAALFSSVLYAGTAGAIATFMVLFDADIPTEIYADLFIFLAVIFNTFFFLGGIPKLNEEYTNDEVDYPKGLKVFTQFVLLPLVVLYLLIMYAYSVKILISWDWPRGILTYMILGYSIAGMLALLLLHPIQNLEGNKWIKIFSTWFYRALLPLVALLGLAIFKRVSDYGITEERYYVIILSAWLLCVSLYFSFFKSRNIKIIPLSLFVLSFLTTFGPWGAFSVSERSQQHRLDDILVKNKLLTDGMVKKGDYMILGKDYESITSILNYFNRNYDTTNSLYQQFLWSKVSLPDSVKNIHKTNPYGLIEELGIKPIPVSASASKYSNYSYIGLEQSLMSFGDSLPFVLPTVGYNYSIEHHIYVRYSDSNATLVKTFQLDNEVIYATYVTNTGLLTFMRQTDSAACTFDIRTYYNEVATKIDADRITNDIFSAENFVSKKPLFMQLYTIEKTSPNKNFSVKVYVQTINGRRLGKNTEIYDIKLTVLLK